MKSVILWIKVNCRKHRQIVLYLFFGVCTTAINTICYGILHEILLLNNVLSTMIAWLVAVIFAFVTNRAYVFESQRAGILERWSEFLSFFSCRILTGVLDVLIMVLAVDMLKWNSLVWKLISDAIVTLINYAASKFLIFRKSVKNGS